MVDTRGDARRTETEAARVLPPTGGQLMRTATIWGVTYLMQCHVLDFIFDFVSMLGFDGKQVSMA